MEIKQKVLFCRNFRRFKGCHLTFWNYYNHVRSSAIHQPFIHFSEKTVWSPENPWYHEKNSVLKSFDPRGADILILGSRDWEALNADERDNFPVPIVNLILHIRHVEPGDRRHPFLKHKAIRICTSRQMAAAFQKSGVVNGPLFINPHGIDISQLPPGSADEKRDIDILIAGLKQPRLALELKKRLKWSFHFFGKRVEVLTTLMPRALFLEKMGRARITVFLPNPTEGFYRPPMEGMAMGTLVVCPDFSGNDELCQDRFNGLRPAYSAREIVRAIREALRLTPADNRAILQNARETLKKHSMEAERQRFLNILNETPAMWRDKSLFKRREPVALFPAAR
jgi:glycosyltransferase involved in cell wall biosynthesis